MDGERPQLDEPQRRELTGAARSAIEAALGIVGIERERNMETACSGERRGAFVSVYVDGDLRGCVGMITPTESLGQTVRSCAVAAALHDNRFSPLEPDELPRTRLEISVLTPPAACEDPSRIEIGRHGLIVSSGSRRGLLLPQVAAREGWSREVFLDQACRKAGLRAGEWKTGATVETFEAIVFGED